jgi:hypothetical protein
VKIGCERRQQCQVRNSYCAPDRPRAGVLTKETREDKVAAVRRQLQALDLERQRLVARLGELERHQAEQPRAPAAKSTVSNNSPAAEKVALFRRLFSGRTDVFPAR